MATQTRPISIDFGLEASGVLATDVYFRVTDATGTVRSTGTGGWSNSGVVKKTRKDGSNTGVFSSAFTFDTAWGDCTIDWDGGSAYTGTQVVSPGVDITNLPADGDGKVLVNHNSGGADNLRYVYQGSGVDGGIIRAYLTAEYVAGNYALRGHAATKTDGRWESPMYLSPGAYTFTLEKPGVYGVSVATLTVT